MSTKEYEASNVTCIRAPRDKEHPYFMIARAVAQDLSIPLEARGLLLYIFSLPSDWVSHPLHLGKLNGIKNKETIYKYFKILMRSGYCERINQRENGRHKSTSYKFYEEKQLRLIELYKEEKMESSSLPENRNQESEDSEKQQSVKPDTTDNTLHTEKKKKKKSASLPSISFDYETSDFVNISDQDKSDWQALFPGIDIPRQLLLARQWLLDPDKPERDGNRSFITGWLSRAYNDSLKTPKQSKSPKTSADKPKVVDNQDDTQRYWFDSSIAKMVVETYGKEELLDYLRRCYEPEPLKKYLDTGSFI